MCREITSDAPRWAIVIHAYYQAEFLEILDVIGSHDASSARAIYVSTNLENASNVYGLLSAKKMEAKVSIVENRGRDVFPFLETCRDLQSNGHDFLVKVHTKRSPHINNGSDWRRQMVGALLQSDNLRCIERAFDQDHNLGLVGPDRHFVSVSDFIGGNGPYVRYVAKRLGLSQLQVAEAGFFAGTMFAARLAAMEPIIRLGFSRQDFPAEAGQKDGTLAHALERCMTFGAIAQRLRVATLENLNASATPHRTLEFAEALGQERGMRHMGKRLGRAMRQWRRR